jgi:hypothetical protein
VDDTTHLVVAVTTLITAFGSLVAALAALWRSILNGQKTDAIHVDLNSRLTQLTESVRKQAHAEGLAEGVEQERTRPAPKPPEVT